MASNVPIPVITDAGIEVPTEAEIIEGLILDWQAAFGGKLNLTTTDGALINSTPQGQLIITQAAIIAQAYYALLALFNGFDPAFSSGRMQDGIARIYYLQRLPDTSTTVTVECIGAVGTVIPQLASVIDDYGNLYYAETGGTIPISGVINLQFFNKTPGPIPCPAGTVNRIYQQIAGWDAVSNAADGVIGTDVETRAEFEARRELTVFNNSFGFGPSMLGHVMKVDGVLDAYVADNSNNYKVGFSPTAVVTGSISGTALTLSAVLTGTVATGLTVTGADGTGISVADGTTITGGSGLSWTVNNSQTVAATQLNIGGVIVNARSVHAIVSGGAQADIAKALWEKKPPGAAWQGNTTVVVYDEGLDDRGNPQYIPPGIPYTVKYETPAGLDFAVLVKIVNSSIVPADALAQIQEAVLAAFAGTDGGARVRIGQTVLASRFMAGVVGLGEWAQVVEILIGSTNAPTVQATASVAATTMTVTAIASGTLAVGQSVFGDNIVDGTYIVSQLTGSAGSTGTYQLNQTMTAASAGIKTVMPSLYRIQTLINQLPTIAAGNVTMSLV